MRLALFIAWILAVLASVPAHAGVRMCADAIAHAERRAAWLPDGLLYAIALTESAHRPAGARAAVPWPWTINSPKGSFYLGSRREAAAKVRELQALGVSNIDVGCMQINLHFHPTAFRSLDDAFDPTSNVAYAVRFLRELRREHRTLFDVVGRYHSGTPWRSEAYATKVFARWENGDVAPPSRHGLGTPDSRLIADERADPEAVGAPAGATGPGRWQRVYGTHAGTGAQQLQRAQATGWLRRDANDGRTVPRGAGQIGFR